MRVVDGRFVIEVSEHRSRQHWRLIHVRSDSSKKVIYNAIVSNLTIAIFKYLAAFFTGSHAGRSVPLHSRYRK